MDYLRRRHIVVRDTRCWTLFSQAARRHRWVVHSVMQGSYPCKVQSAQGGWRGSRCNLTWGKTFFGIQVKWLPQSMASQSDIISARPFKDAAAPWACTRHIYHYSGKKAVLFTSLFSSMTSDHTSSSDPGTALQRPFMTSSLRRTDGHKFRADCRIFSPSSQHKAFLTKIDTEFN